MPFKVQDIRETLAGVQEARISHSFIEAYSDQCEEFASLMSDAFLRFRLLDRKLSKTKYGAYLAAVSYAALSNHVLSLRLLILGALVPAGNLQRYVLESIALALLGSDRTLPMFQNYIDGNYSTTKAIPQVIRHCERLKLNKLALLQLQDAARHYDRYSHPTAMTLATTMISTKGAPEVVLGGIFDATKRDIYHKEISSRVGLAGTFRNLLDGIDRNASTWCS